MTEYIVVVVDVVPKPFPPAKQMLEAGVPISVAARWLRFGAP